MIEKKEENKINDENIKNVKEIKYNKKIFYIIFFGILATIISYISWVTSLFWTVLTILTYSLFAYVIYIIWRLIIRKERLEYIKFLDYFLYKISIWLFIGFIIVWSFVYYKNEISPTKMPTYTLSNWKKIVVFQTMSHIWSKNFYEKIKNNLIKRKKDWFIYFYEWVKPWKKENHEKFDKAMWIKFDKNLYKNFSKLYWVVHQDNSIYMNLVNNKDYNIDLWLDEIMKLYDKSDIKKERKINLLQNDKVIDANKEIIKTLASLNNKELKILRYINKWVLNFMIWSKETQNIIMDNFSNKKLFDIILNKRNDILSEEIINSKHKKIFITYWLLHFDWVLELLKKEDKNWKIIEIKYMFPIK